MFEGIRNWWRDVKIDAAFPKWEAEARAAHLASAAKRFPTAQLRAEIERLMAPDRQRCDHIFGGPIAAVQTEIATLEREIAQLHEHIALLGTNYKELLDPLYERKRKIEERQREASAEKAQAHSDLQSAKDSVDAWHRKSTGTWFGNGGRKLPKHSIFGQSFGDLDGYKADRGNAVHAIQHAAAELDRLGEAWQELKVKIDELKTARGRRDQLMAQGVRLPVLQKRLRDASRSRAEQGEVLTRLNERRNAFLEQAWHRSGAQVVQDAISQAEAARQEFIDSFDRPGASEHRRSEHRATFRA